MPRGPLQNTTRQLTRALRSRRAWWLLPLVAFLCVALPHLNDGDWQRGDGGWYSAIGLQAWRTGNLWTLHEAPGRVYFNKPPLVFWIHGAGLWALGSGPLQARLSSVVAGALAVLLVALVARRAAGRAAGASAGVVIALTYEFTRRTREVSLDLWQMVFLLAAAALVIEALQRRRAALIALAGFPLGLALLCKPLIALLAIPLLGAWLIAAGRVRLLPWLGGAIMLVLAVALPWHVSMLIQHGPAFLHQYFGREIADRASGSLVGGQSRTQPPWFYVAAIVRGYWPWLAVVAAAVVAALRGQLVRRELRLLAFGALWSAIWLSALTAFPDRRDRYAVVLYAGLAWMAAAFLGAALRRAVAPTVVRNLWATILTRAMPAMVVGALVFAVLPVRVQRPVDPQWPALFDWLANEGNPPLWDGGFAGAPSARVYLLTGRWATPARNSTGDIVSWPDAGDLIAYHRRGGFAPGPHETVVFSRGDITVTRLDAEAWQPREAPDPGE